MAYFRNVTLNIEDFDSEEEYSRALLEQERIQKILSNVDITDANVAKQLYDGFNEHPEMFRSRVGTEFMDVLKENSVGDDTSVQPVVNEQPQATQNTEIDNQEADSQELESEENHSQEIQDEEMVDTLTPELMKEAQEEEAQISQTPQEVLEDEEATTQEDMAEQSLQEAEAQALWEQSEEEIQTEEVEADELPQEVTEEQSLQKAEAQALWEQPEEETQTEEVEADELPQEVTEEQSLQEAEAQALWEQSEEETQTEEIEADELPQEATEEQSLQENENNEDSSDDYIADSNEAEAMAIKEESELVKPEVLHMEKPQILKKISASVNSINNTDIANNNNITDNKLDNNQDNIINNTKKDNINKQNNNKSVQKSVQKIKADRPELTYIGLIRWVLIIAPFVIISFPMAGAILSGICALYAFIKVWGAYINDKMKPVDILKSLLYIVLFPVGIVMSVFGIMKKIKYVYYNRKAILYSFIIYLIPVIFFCNVGLISSNNMVSLLLPIINVFLNATLVGRIAVVLDVIVVAIVIICIASSFSKKVAILIYDYIDKGMTQAQALQFVICLPIVVMCMFKAFIDGKVLYEDKIVK